MSNWWSVFIAMRGAYLIAARAWPEVSVGKIKLFDAEGTGGGRVSLAGEEGEAGRVGRWVPGGEGRAARGVRDAMGMGRGGRTRSPPHRRRRYLGAPSLQSDALGARGGKTRRSRGSKSGEAIERSAGWAEIMTGRTSQGEGGRY